MIPGETREYLICDDCRIFHANGEFPELSPCEDRDAAILAGAERLGSLAVGELDNEFSAIPCDACNAGAGPRWHASRFIPE